MKCRLKCMAISTQKTLNGDTWFFREVRGLKRLRLLLVLMLVFSLLSVPQTVKAEEVVGVNLIVNNFLNNSTAKTLSWLVFDSPTKPNPNQVDNVIFEWYYPNGSLAFTDIVDPDTEAVAWSYFHVDQLGEWSLNVSYETDSSINNTKSFDVVDDHWGPGKYVVSRSTMVSSDATLTIEPGTEVAFDQNKSLGVEGKIVAQGNDLSPIVLTSNLTPQSPGDWASLKLYDGSDSTSVLDNIILEYSREGLVLDGASVTVINSTFINNTETAIHLVSSQSFVKGNYIERGDSGIHPIGIRSLGSTLTVENNEIHFMSTGMYLLNSDDTTRGNLVMDSQVLGLFVVNSLLESTDDRFVGNWNAMQIESDSDAVFENLTILGFKEGIAVFDDSNATLWNSTIDHVEVTTFELARGCSVSLVNSTFRTIMGDPGVSIGLTDDSLLFIQNFLTVEVISHDNGSHLAGASVEVLDATTAVQSLETGPNGFTQPVVATDRIYRPTVVNYGTLISVEYPDLAFENNHRIVNMDSSHIETFNGSIHDLDEDGEPDFSDEDIDGDDLSNDIETGIGADPRDPDSDDDGIPDGYEFDHIPILDPLSAGDATSDPDDDGLTNLEEYLNGTSPVFADSDDDGVDDLMEMDCGMNPLNQSDADDDWDDDGFNNGKECRAGTDLQDADDKPAMPDSFSIILVVAVIAVIVIVAISIILIKRRRAPLEEELVREEDSLEEESEETG